MQKSGSLEIICGSMFSGKSDELIRRLKRCEYAKLNIQVFKHNLDNRVTIEHVRAHNGSMIKAIAISKIELLLESITQDTEVIGIDEIQFFDKNIIEIILKLVKNGKRVIGAGLDLDFRGIPFGSIPELMAIADKVTKLKAICMECGEDSHYTQRLVNGRPARNDDPIVLIGAEDCYQARCRKCYII